MPPVPDAGGTTVPVSGNEPLGPGADVVFEYGYGADAELDGIELVTPVTVPGDGPAVPLLGNTGTVEFGSGKGGWLEDDGDKEEIPVPEVESPGTVPLGPTGNVVLGNGNGASVDGSVELETPVLNGPDVPVGPG